MAGPDARSVLQPTIYSKTIEWRKLARRGKFPDDESERMESRLAEYSNAVRKMKAA